MKPKFQHDCSKCTFLGHYHNHDTYICLNSDGGNGSIVARYSNDGPDYASTPLFLLETVTSSPECREIEYVQAWIAALNGQKFKQLMDTVSKLSKVADTLQEFVGQSNSELAS